MVEFGLVEPGGVADDDVILDVRRHPGSRQIRGALRYDPKVLLDAERLLLPLGHERRIVLDAENAADAKLIGEHLIASGFQQVVGLHGGFAAWQHAGLPDEPASQEQPVPGKSEAGIHLL